MKAKPSDVVEYEDYLKTRTNFSETYIRDSMSRLKSFLLKNPDIDIPDDYNKEIMNKTIKKRGYALYYIFRNWIDYIVEDSKVRQDIIRKLIKPEIRDDIKIERKYMNEDQIMDIINRLESKKHRMIAILQSLFGSRSGDIMKVELEHISIEEIKDETVIQIILKKAKGNRRHMFFLYDPIAQMLLMDYLKNLNCFEDYIFLDKGETITGSKRLVDVYTRNYIYYWRDLKRAIFSFGLKKTDFATHDFRRCFARRVWDRYKDLYVLKDMLNHQDVNTSFRYLRHSGQDTIDYQKEMQQ